MALQDIIRGFMNGSAAAPVVVQMQPAVQQPTHEQHVNGNTTVPNSATPASDGTVKAIPKAGEGEASPLADFSKLWDKPEKEVTQPSLVPSLNIDPSKLMELAKGLDFTKLVSPETLKKAQTGDSAALVDLMNQVGQAAYAQSASANTEILKTSFAKMEDAFFKKVMPEQLRRNANSQALREDNPIFENPAVAPMLAALETQLSTKYPTASPAEISAHAKKYFLGMSAEIAKANGMEMKELVSGDVGGKGKSRASVDNWDEFFGTGT